MDQQIGIRDFINQRTKQYNIGDLSKQSPKIQEQLLQVEEYLQNLICEQTQIVHKIKELGKINLMSVATGAEVPRSSIYNSKNVLQVYIERRCAEIEKDDILDLRKSGNLKTKDKELKNIMDGLKKQVVETYELQLLIKELEIELASQIKQNSSFMKKNRVLEKEVKEQRKKLGLPITNVVSIEDFDRK